MDLSQAAVELTRRAFPSLCNVPDQKIVFEVAPDKDMGSFGPNITILDDAWEAMATSPARAMLVSVKESHEDVEKSEPQIRQMATNILGANNLHQIGLNDLICRNETRVERVVQGRRYDHRMHCRRIDALHRYGRLVDQRMNGRRDESDIQPEPNVRREHRAGRMGRSGWSTAG